MKSLSQFAIPGAILVAAAYGVAMVASGKGPQTTRPAPVEAASSSEPPDYYLPEGDLFEPFVPNHIDRGEGLLCALVNTPAANWTHIEQINPWKLSPDVTKVQAIMERFERDREQFASLYNEIIAARAGVLAELKEIGAYEPARPCSEEPNSEVQCFLGYRCPSGDPPGIRYWLIDFSSDRAPKLVKVEEDKWPDYSRALRDAEAALQSLIPEYRQALFR